jgi:fatty-acyl-CoA synthase
MYPGAHAAVTPEKAAAIDPDTGAALTYGDLEANSARLARVWHQAGLRPGDGVALLTDNCLTAFEVYWAALRSGLYVTAVNRHLTTGEVAYIVNDCGAVAFVGSTALADVAADVLPRTPDVRLALAFGGPVTGFESYRHALAGVPSAPLEHQPRGTDMLYSSGTTGRPKGIKPPLPTFQVHEPGDTLTAVFGPMYRFGTDTVYLSPAPISHAAPLRFCGVVQALGGTVVLMRAFDAEQALAAIEEFRVTHSQWVPTMFVRMLKLPPQVRARYDVSSLRYAIHAAAPCPIDVKRAMIDWWGPVLCEYYAATEGNGITFIDSQQWLARPGSVGRDGFLGIVHICADDGTELPAGEVGAVFFERDELPFEYHHDEQKTRAAQHPEHPTWTTTGDIGYLDADRFLYLTDRKAFVIISGGVNVYPQEVENALTLHPKVLDVAVIGLPDEEMGEVVRAVVQPASGVQPGPELERELIDHLREGAPQAWWRRPGGSPWTPRPAPARALDRACSGGSTRFWARPRALALRSAPRCHPGWRRAVGPGRGPGPGRSARGGGRADRSAAGPPDRDPGPGRRLAAGRVGAAGRAGVAQPSNTRRGTSTSMVVICSWVTPFSRR